MKYVTLFEVDIEGDPFPGSKDELIDSAVAPHGTPFVVSDHVGGSKRVIVSCKAGDP